MRLIGTRDVHDVATFSAATSGGVPEHGGLFTLADWPRWNDVDQLLAMSWRSRCTEILHRLIGDEFDRTIIADIVHDALDFEAPVVRLADGTLAVELFHGPTLAFKDFGARLLAALLARIPTTTSRTILTATSGDTGAAVAHAFWCRTGVRVVVLYPKGRVSPLQERQIASLGENVSAFAVEGSFDDCQALVKSCFADRALSRELGLTSANSINIARLVAQVLYYFEAVAGARGLGANGPLVVSIPSGNFGNVCAALMAWKFGLPVKTFIAATNSNDTVPRYLASSVYEPRATIPTMSNAMDVSAPSNWERIESLFSHDMSAVKSVLRAERVDEASTTLEIERLAALGYVACPHSAVASSALRKHVRSSETGLFVATAHPAKFGEVLEPILKRRVDVPERLAKLANRPVLSRTIDTDAGSFVNSLRAALA
ncbi:MAG: threonine synthase [Planctomycetota bacterium]|nr:threonine synthase [Planctomycetota bacterium]